MSAPLSGTAMCEGTPRAHASGKRKVTTARTPSAVVANESAAKRTISVEDDDVKGGGESVPESAL